MITLASAVDVAVEESLGWWIVSELTHQGCWGPFPSYGAAQANLVNNHPGYAPFGVSDNRIVFIEYGYTDEEDIFSCLDI